MTCCQLSHSGKFAAVGSDLENALTIWDTSEGKIIHKMQSKYSRIHVGNFVCTLII